MKWIVYNLLFAIVYPFLLPGFLTRMLKRGGYAARMGDRFALYPPEVNALFGPPVESHSLSTSTSSLLSDFVWIHAVSVGEVQVAGQLMREWRKADPKVRFCFSTTSSTGWKIAEKELASRGRSAHGAWRGGATRMSPPRGRSGYDEGGRSGYDGDVLIYNPLDFPNFVKSALRRVRPRAIVLTESEIWPNFILRAKKLGIPLYLINARVSDRSAPRYKLARFFFKDVFGAFTRIFAQSELDAERIRAAMKPEDADKVVVTGSFKFDVAHRNEAKEAELLEWIFPREPSVPARPKILLGGSTWPGEDKVLLKIYKSIVSPVTCHLSPSPSHLSPLLVLAPRHFEKADEVEANIKAAGFTCIRRSRGDKSAVSPATCDLPPVFLCDTTGEMMGLFGICDVAFVGKSLCAHGSQNMIEPCLCGKPTVVGPYTENFRPVMSDLLAANAIVQVKDEAELGREITRLMTDDAAAKALGERATAAVMNRRGVVPRCIESIRAT